MFMPAIAEPVAIALKGITDPSDMVIPPSMTIEVIADCIAESKLDASAAAAVGSLSQAMVTGGALGVAIGTMRDMDVIEVWAIADGTAARTVRDARIVNCILYV